MTDYQAEPSAPPAPQHATPEPSRRKVSRGQWIVAAAIVGVGAIAAILAVTLTGGGAKPLTVHGTLTIADLTGGVYVDDSSHACSGVGGYSDIDEGTEVVISDDSGKTLAITHLDAGHNAGVPDTCTWDFTANVPAGKKFYGVTISHRGTVKFSESQIRSPALSLGN